MGILEQAGARNLCVNAGGDVLARGEPEPGRAWRVGIRHPEVAGKVAAVLAVRDLAVATSGLYERVEWVAGIPGYAGYAVTAERRCLWSDGCEPLLVQDLGR